MTKVCRDCKRELPLSEFYIHKQMLDGHLNKCKDCVKDRISKHRERNLDKVREYDRGRAHLPHRRKQGVDNTRRRRREVPGYNAAHNKLAKTAQSGEIKRPDKCECCGHGGRRDIVGHHFDYSRPLDVIWLCQGCHAMYHTGKNKSAQEVRQMVDELIRSKFKVV